MLRQLFQTFVKSHAANGLAAVLLVPLIILGDPPAALADSLQGVVQEALESNP